MITGFRDAALEKLIEAEGGEVQSSSLVEDHHGDRGIHFRIFRQIEESARSQTTAGKANIKLIDLATFP